jgi:hypothetical protein
MFVIAHHFINEPEEFWAASQQFIPSIPQGFKLHSVFPSKDLKTGTCVWEADSASALQNLLDGIAGKMAKNVCYEVKEEIAIGLPQKNIQEAFSA